MTTSDEGKGRPLVDVGTLADDTLVRALRHLNRSTKAGRLKAATDPVTKMYLQAGLRLLANEFQPTAAEHEPDPQPPVFFAWVSRSRVAAESVNEPPQSGLPRGGSVVGLRDRWDPHRDFIADLLLVALATDHWSAFISEDSTTLNLVSSGDLVSAIHRIALSDIQAISKTVVAFQIQLIATSFAERDPRVRGALKALYEVVTESWSSVYAAMLEARGLQLRPGISLDDVTHILTAMAEGFALRLLADPDAPVVDLEAEVCLLGTAAVAMFSGFFDFRRDGITVDDYFRSLSDTHTL